MNYGEFRSLVNRMRAAQKTYFRTRKMDDLEFSKRAEAEVDKALREYGEGQKRLIQEGDGS